MFTIIFGYAVMKGEIMINYKDINIQEPTMSNYYGPEFTYNGRDGWRIAFGLTAYDDSSDPDVFDESYGTIGAFSKVWGEKDE